MRWIWGAVPLLFVATMAHAQSVASSVRWSMPEECGSKDAFVAQIELSPERFAQLSIEMIGHRQADAFVIDLAVARGENAETRTLSAPTCQEASTAAAVVIAVMADAMDATAAASTSAALPASPPAENESPLVLQAAVRAQFLIDYGAVDIMPILGARVDGAIRFNAWFARVGGFLLVRGQANDGDGHAAVFHLVGGMLRGGYAFDLHRLWLELEAGIDFGRLLAKGTDGVDGRRTSLPWGSVHFGMGLRIPIWSVLSARLDVEMYVPWFGYAYVFDGIGKLGETNRAGVRGGFGFELNF